MVNGRKFCGRWPIERERKSGFHLKNPQIYGKNLNIQSARPTTSIARSLAPPVTLIFRKVGKTGFRVRPFIRPAGADWNELFPRFWKRKEGREGGKPSRQSSSQSECEEWGEIEASEGRDTFSNHFHCRRPFSQPSCTRELCKSANFRRLVVLLLQNEREGPFPNFRRLKKGQKISNRQSCSRRTVILQDWANKLPQRHLQKHFARYQDIIIKSRTAYSGKA